MQVNKEEFSKELIQELYNTGALNKSFYDVLITGRVGFDEFCKVYKKKNARKIYKTYLVIIICFSIPMCYITGLNNEFVLCMGIMIGILIVIAHYKLRRYTTQKAICRNLWYMVECENKKVKGGAKDN